MLPAPTTPPWAEGAATFEVAAPEPDEGMGRENAGPEPWDRRAATSTPVKGAVEEAETAGGAADPAAAALVA